MGNHLRISLLSIYVCAAIDTLGFIIRGWGSEAGGHGGIVSKIYLSTGDNNCAQRTLPYNRRAFGHMALNHVPIDVYLDIDRKSNHE